MRFIENTKSAIVLYVLFHCTRTECNGTYSIALLGNGIFYLISRDHKQPIKRSEFNKVLYNIKPYCVGYFANVLIYNYHDPSAIVRARIPKRGLKNLKEKNEQKRKVSLGK
jgi:hypothetical protein